MLGGQQTLVRVASQMNSRVLVDDLLLGRCDATSLVVIMQTRLVAGLQYLRGDVAQQPATWRLLRGVRLFGQGRRLAPTAQRLVQGRAEDAVDDLAERRGRRWLRVAACLLLLFAFHFRRGIASLNWLGFGRRAADWLGWRRRWWGLRC